jgi:hypothetical protein
MKNQDGVPGVMMVENGVVDVGPVDSHEIGVFERVGNTIAFLERKELV